METITRNNNMKKYWKMRERALKSIKLRNREDILNVFTPASAITIPAKFGGREGPLEEMIAALLTKGADLIVFGERGCGKSSLAHMLHYVAKGQFEILEYYGLRDHLEKKGLLQWLMGTDRKTFNVICVDGFGRTIDEVIHSVLTRRHEPSFGPGVLAYIPREADQIEISAKIGFDKVFTAAGEVKEVHIPEKPMNIKAGFDIAMQQYAAYNDEELIIIIDEFETVKGRSEISQYLKSVKNARFVLVGIAETAFDMVGQHASVARETHAVELDPMKDEELQSILQIGSYILRSVFLSFEEMAIEEIIGHCSGSPYWCHFLAKALVQDQLELQRSFEEFMNSANKIKKEDVSTLLDGLPRHAGCKIYEEQLRATTLQDETTAKVLLYIAKEQESIMSSASVCSSLEKEEKIPKDVSLETINGLIQMESSPFNQKSQIRDIISFSFLDPNFKRYILIRNAGLT